jgi:predicted Zn-dependent protease
MLRNFLIMSGIVLAFSSCQKNTITGRKQLILVSESELQQMASLQYDTFLIQHKVIPAASSKDAAMVNRVGGSISKAISDFYKKQGKAGELNGYKWEFHLVEDKAVNAWCMPGGKVVVYTGLLPVSMNEEGLAVVMGHEIAHAIAQHGNERMSQGLVQQLGGVALSVAVSSQPVATQNLFLEAYGVGTELGGVLPFSRKQELEADRYGLIFSAMAGFNPQEAIAFWQRMSKVGDSGTKPPEFLSTHPSDETRIKKVGEYATEAMKYYQPALR